jgi:sugar (pentulose or hexulose) kinase
MTVPKSLNSVAAGFTASKISWTKKHEPEISAKIRHILLLHDYLNYWLTGNFVINQSDALELSISMSVYPPGFQPFFR